MLRHAVVYLIAQDLSLRVIPLTKRARGLVLGSNRANGKIVRRIVLMKDKPGLKSIRSVA